MIQKLRESRGWQLLIIAGLILLMPLIVDINGRISVIRRMHQEETRLKQELADIQAEQEALQTQLDFVASDAYLEQWARVDARMTRPGEVTIIPAPTNASEQTALGLENNLFPATAPPPSIPEQWRRLFFGDTP
ncbi:MAG: septum formation initiator family protein [Anaerolineae bacterium]|jgi:cell division protein FtsB